MDALAGWRIAVTRPVEQAESLTAMLRGAGATIVATPLIRIEPPSDRTALERAARQAQAYDWLVFTSANGVRAFGAMAHEHGGISRFAGTRCATVGPATAAALEEIGLRAEVVPDAQVGAALAEAMAAAGLAQGAKVLWPCAEHAPDRLGPALGKFGVALDAVPAYRTVGDEARGGALAALVRTGAVDVLTFASSSAVHAYAAGAGSPAPSARVVAVIGPVTRGTAERAGLRVDVEPVEHTAAGLVDALIRYRRENR